MLGLRSVKYIPPASIHWIPFYTFAFVTQPRSKAQETMSTSVCEHTTASRLPSIPWEASTRRCASFLPSTCHLGTSWQLRLYERWGNGPLGCEL